MADAIVVAVLALVAGVSLGTAGTVLRSTRGLLKEKDERLELLEEKIGEVEALLKKHGERISTLEDFTLSSFKEGGVKHQESAPEEDDEDLDLRIWVLYNNGYSLRRIAGELGLSKSTVQRRLQKVMQQRAKRKDAS